MINRQDVDAVRLWLQASSVLAKAEEACETVKDGWTSGLAPVFPRTEFERRAIGI